MPVQVFHITTSTANLSREATPCHKFCRCVGRRCEQEHRASTWSAGDCRLDCDAKPIVALTRVRYSKPRVKLVKIIAGIRLWVQDGDDLTSCWTDLQVSKGSLYSLIRYGQDRRDRPERGGPESELRVNR